MVYAVKNASNSKYHADEVKESRGFREIAFKILHPPMQRVAAEF